MHGVYDLDEALARLAWIEGSTLEAKGRAAEAAEAYSEVVHRDPRATRAALSRALVFAVATLIGGWIGRDSAERLAAMAREVWRVGAPDLRDVGARLTLAGDVLAELVGEIRDARLLTIVGPGGVGKTRLLRELCRRLMAIEDSTWQAGFIDRDAFRSVILTASMAPGVNTYIFANMYGTAKRVAASGVLLSTAASVLTIWLWLLILP